MNKEKILKQIENIEQLSADMKYKVKNMNDFDLKNQIYSIKEWLKKIEKEVK